MASRRRPDPRRASPAPRRMLPRSMWAILALALFLRGLGLDDVVGGFHDRGEAAYTLMAAHLTPATLLFPNPDGRLFLETPPLYAWLLALLFRFTGVSVVAARLFTIGTGLGLVVATYALGRRLASQRAGVAAALLVAVAPVAVLTGRTVEPDTPTAFLSVIAVLLYARTQSEEGTRGDAVAFGVALGLAMFTGLSAVALVPALAAWELAVPRAIHGRRRLRTLAIGLTIAAVLPLLFYAFHFARDFAAARALVVGDAAAKHGLPTSGAEWAGLLIEAIWAFSPPVTMCAAAGLAVALVRRIPSLLLPVLLLGACGVVFAFAHTRGDGVLMLLPWAAILAGAAFEGIPPDAVRRTILGVAAAGAAFVTVVDLTAMKLGFTEFSEFGREAKTIGDASYPLLVTHDMLDSHGTVLRFYDPRARLVAVDRLPRDPDGRLQLPDAPSVTYLLTFVPPQTRSAAGGALLKHERYGLELFGRTLAEAHPSAQHFRQGRYFVEKTGRPLDFGLKPLRSYPALAFVPIRSGIGLWATPSGITVRAAPERRPATY